MNLRIDSLKVQFEDNISLLALGLISKEVPSEHFKNFAVKTLEDINKRFKNQLKNWDGEVSKFETYQEILRQNIFSCFSAEKNDFERKMDNIFDRIIDGDLSALDDLK